MEQDFVYYPVNVKTLNRYEHFKRLVESLQRNTDADKTELVIGLDYPPSEKYREGYEKIKAYLPTISGFKKVTIFTTDENLGPLKNGDRLKAYIEEQGYDGCIGTEDDNEFSPNFIQYMNWGLNHFRNDKSIYAICAFNGLNTEGVEGNVYKLNNIFSAWGNGQWFNRRSKLAKYRDLWYLKDILDNMPITIVFSKKIFRAHAIIGMLYGGWAFGDTILMFLPDDERWCVFPIKNKVRNWGQDGSGMHGASKKGYIINSTITIDSDTVFEGDVRENIYSQIMEERFKSKYKHSARDYFKSVVVYLVYKMTGKIPVGNHNSKWCKIKLDNLKLPKEQ